MSEGSGVEGYGIGGTKAALLRKSGCRLRASRGNGSQGLRVDVFRWDGRDIRHEPRLKLERRLERVFRDADEPSAPHPHEARREIQRRTESEVRIPHGFKVSKRTRARGAPARPGRGGGPVWQKGKALFVRPSERTFWPRGSFRRKGNRKRGFG